METTRDYPHDDTICTNCGGDKPADSETVCAMCLREIETTDELLSNT